MRSYSGGKQQFFRIILIQLYNELFESDNSLNGETHPPHGESSGIFKLVERKDIQKILEEQNLQLSGITEGENAVKIGQILNAEVLFTGNLFKRRIISNFL